MKLFVTGATGALGAPVTRRLVAAGHEVRALSRSESNRAPLAEWGATPVEADLFEAESLARAMDGCEAVLHLATRIPPVAELKKPEAWSRNDRIRSGGTRAIAAAARQTAGLRTLLYPSVTFLYADGADRWIDADTATLDLAGPLRSTLDAETEVAAFAESGPGRRGIVLRFGAFYGPVSADSRQALAMARKGFAMGLAAPDAYRSMIWIEDAASAVVSALESGCSGIYDVVESEPFTQAQSTAALARAVGRRSLFTTPRWLLRFALPAEMRGLLARSQRVSNRRFRAETGWSPSVPSQREGWPLMAEAEGAGEPAAASIPPVRTAQTAGREAS